MTNKPRYSGNASAEELLTLLIRLAQEYLNQPLEKAAESIDNSLAEVGEFVGADRAYLFKYHDELTRCSNTHEWCAADIPPQIEILQNVDVEEIPEWINAHRRGQEMHIPDVPDLPRNARLYQILGPQGIKSVLTVPLLKEGVLIGFIGFDSVRQYHHYSDTERHILGIFAQLLVNFEKRREAIEEVYYERDRAEKANAAKSSFLANMSHEIRTPLHSVIGFCELLQQSALDEEQQHFVATIEHSSNLLLGLVNDILDLAKVEAGKLELASEPVSLRQIATHIYQMFSAQVARQNIALHVDLQLAGQDVVCADELRLTQVIMNLVSNAVKWTREGEVQLSIHCTQKHQQYADYAITVVDTGVGIAAATLDRLFKPFEQASATRTTQGGTGLGLSISQRIVQAMGSQIFVESTEGEGSRFFFNLTLPRATAAMQEELAQAEQWVKVPDFSGRKILVAEDVQVNQELLRHLLLPTGCQFSFVETGTEAVDLASRARFDLIIMDLQMPEMNGLVAAEHILRQRPEQTIIAFSAAAAPADVAQFKASGMRGHLAKPVRQQTLYQQLQEFMPN